jgi:formylglycine-generating enzyme required for sulfatase activity
VPGKVTTFKARVYADDGKGPNNMVLVPAGSFAYQGNYTTLTYLGTFMIDKYEVTNDQYCAFLNNNDPAGAHYSSGMGIDQQGTSGQYSYSVQTGKGSYPITYVSALDAEAFAAWRSSVYGGTYRLPTEQEWEKAAGWDPVRQYEYIFGFQRDSQDCTWYNMGGCYSGPLPVGSFNGTGGKQDAKSYYGCYDMSGNVSEWTSSTWDGNRISRGGFWNEYCVITSREAYSPDRHPYIWFRLVLDLN